MTVIVEDGSIVANANSYVSIADADDYFTYERPNVTDWCDLTDTQKEASLRYAAILLGKECWHGRRSNVMEQTLDWPRDHVWDEDRLRFYTASEIPTEVKQAQMELALALSREDRTLIGENAGGAGLERVKVDVLEVEWMPNAAQEAEKAKSLIPDIVYTLLEDLLECSRGGIMTPLFRI